MIKGRNYGIDILRGIALILISIYHYYQFQGTYIGVIIFFTLSGYLVTESLLVEDFQYVTYWKKKIQKLYPLLLVVIIVSTLFVFFLEKGLTDTYRFGAISSVFAFSNVYQAFSKISYFESHNEILPLIHTWALSLEIQFYICYPILLFYLKKLKKTSQEITGILFFLSLFSMLCMFFKYVSGEDVSKIYYGTDTRVFSFLLAAGLASSMQGRKIVKKQYIQFLSYIGLLSIFLFSFFVDYTSAWNYLGGLYFASFFISYVIVACLRTNFLEKIQFYPVKILAHLGKHGYSYYLWQYVIMIFANEYFKWIKISYHLTVFLEVCLLVGVSEVTYRWIEKRKFSWKEIAILFIVTLSLLFFLPKASIRDNEEMEQKIESLGEVTKNTSQELIFRKQEKKESSLNQIEESLAYGEEEAKEVVPQPKKDVKNQKSILPKVVYPEQITFIGDSVMKMCEAELKKDFPKSYVDAAVSRQFTKLPEIIEQIQQKGKLYPVVVIHLGSNGPIREKSFKKVMELLQGHKVFFVNAVVSKAWEIEVNDLLEEEVEQYENASLLDWYQFAKGKSKWFYRDATHPKPNGAKKYSEFILTEILKEDILNKKE